MYVAKIMRIPYFYACEVSRRVAAVKYVCHRREQVKENIAAGEEEKREKKLGWMIRA